RPGRYLSRVDAGLPAARTGRAAAVRRLRHRRRPAGGDWRHLVVRRYQEGRRGQRGAPADPGNFEGGRPMDAEPEVIRQDIEQTRSALTEKLETLEEEVMGTVRNAKETVEETIENVAETVQETVETVQRTFDLEYQMQQRPWVLIGGSVGAGAAVGYFADNP